MRKILLLLWLISVQVMGQKGSGLPRSTPESQGVDSRAILDFLEAATGGKHEFHSFMMLRHGKVVAEAWWKPYRSDLKHTMYSVSKSFTATAVGFAVTEKKLSVEDKVISFFPDDLPDNVSPNLAAMKVKDLLTMSAGHQTDPTFEVASRHDNWVKAFLATPVFHEPGTRFVYNSVATFMLSAIVQKVTGEKIIDYLTPRLFRPLGIEGIDWETNPQGINTGGWGLRLKTEDMAKFGQLFLQKGVWQGKQILPAAWVEEASSMKIMQDPSASQARKDSSDWLQGYAYQMWRSRNNSYRGDGANGQFILVLPEQDAVIAITAEAPDMQGEFNLIWKHLLPAFHKGKLPPNTVLQKQLKEKTGGLALAVPAGNREEAVETGISGRTYGVISGGRPLQNTGLTFRDGVCHLKLDTASLAFGQGQWVYGETGRPGPYLVSIARGNRVGLPLYKVAGAYAWKDSKTLELTLRYIESPHTEVIRCVFEGDRMIMQSEHLFNRNLPANPVKGVQKAERADPPRLIIRGDDMGYSHSGNEALIRAYKEGIETSIEVIVPSPWFPEAVRMLKENPGVDVGMHFAITSEWDNVKWRPLTSAPSLRNADGYFYPMIYPNKNYPGQAVMENTWDPADLEKEFRAQLDLALKYIPKLSHVSGHMNSLAFSPEAKAVLKKVAAEYRLPLVDADAAADYGIHYTGFSSANKNTEERIQAFIAMLDRLENGKTYVYLEHPGLDNEELKAISHIGYENVAADRQSVTDLFTSEKIKEAIQRKGIKLVSYGEVIRTGK